jgi:hypothetical protein
MFIYASVAYIAPVNGFAHFQITSPYPRGTDVFFRIRKHYETDKVEMFGGTAGYEGSREWARRGRGAGGCEAEGRGEEGATGQRRRRRIPRRICT